MQSERPNPAAAQFPGYSCAYRLDEPGGEQIDMFPNITIPRNFNLADIFYERLQENIEEFQKKLAADEQALVLYYPPGAAAVVVQDIGYHNPNSIMLYGQDSEQKSCTV